MVEETRFAGKRPAEEAPGQVAVVWLAHPVWGILPTGMGRDWVCRRNQADTELHGVCMEFRRESGYGASREAPEIIERRHRGDHVGGVPDDSVKLRANPV
ncbi:hypothetical protein CCS01_28765 [Rhodopila globiformis]|uniref:Uncharacterized protein n=1 Tax=Rhodopila globiformis TaxID=1071 RepID=A0A2S6MWY3_RHOGL|nr:hypothetical protein CCS01_28765 [Rhodopila globiformis]